MRGASGPGPAAQARRPGPMMDSAEPESRARSLVRSAPGPFAITVTWTPATAALKLNLKFASDSEVLPLALRFDCAKAVTDGFMIMFMIPHES